MLWNRIGSIEKDGEAIIGNLPDKRIFVYMIKEWISDFYVAIQAPCAAMMLNEPIGVSTGIKWSLEEIISIIEQKKKVFDSNLEHFGEMAELYNAIHSCLAWGAIYESQKDRVVTTVSRTWNVDRNNGGYLICCWDTFFAAYMLAIDKRSLHIQMP